MAAKLGEFRRLPQDVSSRTVYNAKDLKDKLPPYDFHYENHHILVKKRVAINSEGDVTRVPCHYGRLLHMAILFSQSLQRSIEMTKKVSSDQLDSDLIHAGRGMKRFVTKVHRIHSF